MKKYLIIAGGALVVAVLGLVVLAVLNLGTLVKTVTETYGPQFTQSKVELKSADISFFTGSGALKGFVLGNPKGFTEPNALECDLVRVTVDKNSLASDTIVIKEILINGPVVTYEKKGNTDNFKQLQANINKAVSSEESAAAQKKPAPDEQGGQQVNLIIENFIVTNGKVKLAGSLLNTLGGGKAVDIPLPDLHVRDIGRNRQTSPAEAFAVVLSQLSGDVTGTAGQAIKDIGKKAGEVMEGVGKSAGSVGDTIKGLFGGDKQ